MRGQSTVEFMSVFLATIVFFSVLVSAMAYANNKAKRASETVGETVRLEEAERTLEVWSNCGIAMAFGLDGISYRIAGNTVQMEFENKTIVKSGVYNGTSARMEPV